ncbi:MAG TPA: Ig-like domain-containing protein [Arenibacter sp.]|nr:Ig-like domain-containing protein [Arenibacter sp.]
MRKIKHFTIYTFFTPLFLILFTIIGSCDEAVLKDDLDITNPYVISYNPVSGVDGVALNSNLVITFDDIVFKGEGKIRITTDIEEANQIIDVNDAAVTLSNVNRVMTIKAQDFMSGREYQVVLDKGIVRDSVGNRYFGMPDNEIWKFKTGGNPDDTDAPELLATSPVNGDSGAGIFSFELQFNEDVKTGTGNFVIHDAVSDAVVHTIDALGEGITVKGKSITVKYPAPLAFGAAYYVQFGAGVVKDVAGNSYTGFADGTSLNFTTVAGSATDLVLHLPFDTDLRDVSGNKFDASLGATATAAVEFVNDPDRGSVIKFNAGSYATLPTHPLLRSVTPTDDFSVNFWVKTGAIGSDPILIGNSDWSSGSNPGWLVCIDNADVYPATGKGWIVKAAPDPKGDFRFDWRASEVSPMAPGIADDQWHMITVVFDRTNAVLYVYRDGEEYKIADQDISRLNNGPLYDVTTDYPINIWEDGKGVYNANSTTRMNLTGFMDDLRIYNKALTPLEVTDLFNN